MTIELNIELDQKVNGPTVSRSADGSTYSVKLPISDKNELTPQVLDNALRQSNDAIKNDLQKPKPLAADEDEDNEFEINTPKPEAKSAGVSYSVTLPISDISELNDEVLHNAWLQLNEKVTADLKSQNLNLTLGDSGGLGVAFKDNRVGLKNVKDLNLEKELPTAHLSSSGNEAIVVVSSLEELKQVNAFVEKHGATTQKTAAQDWSGKVSANINQNDGKYTLEPQSSTVLNSANAAQLIGSQSSQVSAPQLPASQQISTLTPRAH